MYKNVIDPGKSVSFVMKDIDIGGQNQHAMCTGPFNSKYNLSNIWINYPYKRKF